ncbi:hypothetical protein EG68_11047 [Paragonimus skrjabini miyazakii]|uniref:Uncharacterized protein n=1 Tax=Paragonimus skrjabini miyazakii TaxID=59628 RepID=A0A8S9YR07_9TREM|nr:hypothetical protein EG68_11047 [Paragonimus skrjabini miyazakii]
MQHKTALWTCNNCPSSSTNSDTYQYDCSGVSLYFHLMSFNM